jgi:predicted kinase
MEVILLIGLQGAGKSSFYRERFASTHVHVSRDNFRHNPNPLRRQTALIEEALRAGRSVVVDNTHPSRADRAAVFEVAKRFNVPVIGYFFDADLKGCIARNNLRAGKAKVPVVGILATRKKLQPPSLEEGFAALFHVALEPEPMAGFGVTARTAGGQAVGS